MISYWVAAEGKQRMPASGMAGGKGWLSPVGRLHAVDPASQTVLCGEPIRTLVPFPEMTWHGITQGIRCRDCSGQVQAQRVEAQSPALELGRD